MKLYPFLESLIPRLRTDTPWDWKVFGPIGSDDAMELHFWVIWDENEPAETYTIPIGGAVAFREAGENEPEKVKAAGDRILFELDGFDFRTRESQVSPTDPTDNAPMRKVEPEDIRCRLMLRVSFQGDLIDPLASFKRLLSRLESEGVMLDSQLVNLAESAYPRHPKKN